jgi:hypothetical protein
MYFSALDCCGAAYQVLIESQPIRVNKFTAIFLSYCVHSAAGCVCVCVCTAAGTRNRARNVSQSFLAVVNKVL